MPRQPPPASALPTDVSEYDTMQGPSTTSPFINAGKMMMAGPQTAPHLPVPPKGAWDEQDSGSSNSSEFISNGNPMYHSIAIQTSPSMLEAATSTGSDAGGLRSVVTAPAMVNWQEAAEETASCWNQFDDGLLGNANNLGMIGETWCGEGFLIEVLCCIFMLLQFFSITSQKKYRRIPCCYRIIHPLSTTQRLS
eukprot:TRINITY_DN25671_c0_g1_i2.p1 TRINITY_DN25671_c0_g1~~TRINITY_DN25671_c0_g1_i2.p1  ORF type:complete len:194 (+),score=21.00 TRINITY_DN25671_c0_g1_i2:63-644(+)